MRTELTTGPNAFVIPFIKSTSTAPLKEFTETPIPEKLKKTIRDLANALSEQWRNAFFQGQLTDIDEPTRGSVFLTRCIQEMGDSSIQLQSQTELIVAQFLAVHTLKYHSVTKLPNRKEIDSRENVRKDLAATDEQMEEGVLLLACGEAVKLVSVLREKAPEFLKNLEGNYNNRWQLSK